MRGLEALLGLLDAADRHGGIEKHHALDDEGRAAFQLRVLRHHHVDILEDASELGCDKGMVKKGKERKNVSEREDKRRREVKKCRSDTPKKCCPPEKRLPPQNPIL